MGPGPARESQEQFSDLIRADSELIRVEFDGLSEVAWGGGPSPPQADQAQDTELAEADAQEPRWSLVPTPTSSIGHHAVATSRSL